LNKKFMQTLMKNTKKSSITQDVKTTKKNTKKKVVKEFDYNIMVNGGESVLSFKDSNGVSRVVDVSVHTSKSSYFSKYKFHYKNALGNRVYIKTQKASIAQEVCDYLSEEKWKYKVSGSYI